MKILVCSCDKDDDTFEPFHHCMEKYWHEHPEVIYKTETIQNPYYRTIAINYPLHQWSNGIKEALEQIDDDQILLLMDDIFIRTDVDRDRIREASENLKGNIALMNFELSFDASDLPTELPNWKKRQPNAPWSVSIMCGLWDRKKLLNVLYKGLTPWEVEAVQNTCGYDYYINSGDYIIDWGYRTWQPSGISRGKWQKEVVWFFQKEGIKVDYTKRGIN